MLSKVPQLLLGGLLVLACSEDAAVTPLGVAGASGSGAGASGGATAGAPGMQGMAGSSSGASGLAGGGMAMGGSAAGSGGAAGAAGGGGPAVELSDWHHYGRWDLAQQGKAVTVNSGSHITAKFNGSGISARFDVSGNTGETPTVSIRIDDGALVEKEISATLELAAGLPVAEHDLTLFVRGMNENEVRWTPPLVAATTFLDFTVTGGALVPTSRPERLKMEFLGDSITEGVLLHSQGPSGQNTASWRTDGPRGYASLTAQKMNAEWRQVGFGRQGLTIVGNGGVPKAQDALNWFYAEVPRDDWQPDIVVINQGTNDRDAGGATFAPLYLAFLGLVRAAYPDAKIAALTPLVGAYGSEIEAQVAARKAGGDIKVFYVDTAGWTSQGDFTDGLHPNEPGSVKISDKLVTALQALPD